jgi:hypothetical protein
MGFYRNSVQNHAKMAASGYSGTALIQKLGIKPGMKMRLINAPGNYFELLGANISAQAVKSGGDFVHIFSVSAKSDLWSGLKIVLRVVNTKK